METSITPYESLGFEALRVIIWIGVSGLAPVPISLDEAQSLLGRRTRLFACDPLSNN
jgi:hypothetical protein